MMVTFTITSYQKAALGAAAVHQFDRTGGSFGRDAANDWVLPDPERFISATHGVIYYSEDCFWLRDESTNGIGVGPTRVAIGKGRSIPLRGGEHLSIGDYQIAVQVTPISLAAAPVTAAETELPTDLTQINAPHFDPLAALGSAAPPSAPTGGGDTRAEGRGSESDHSPAFLDPFTPPKALQAELRTDGFEVAPPVIPEDWDVPDSASSPLTKTTRSGATQAPVVAADPTVFPPPGPDLTALQDPALTAPAPDTAPAGAPEIAPTPAPTVDLTSERAATADDAPAAAFGPTATPEPATAPEGMTEAKPELAPHTDTDSATIDSPTLTDNGSASLAEPQLAAFINTDSAAVAEPGPAPDSEPGAVRPTAPRVATPVSASSVSESEALSIFLQAAGLDAERLRLPDDKETLQQFGEMFRHLLDGVMRLLRARAEMKNELRLAQTTVRTHENNPLKFCASGADALQLLFAAQSPGYLSPRAAVAEAVDDLSVHQVALLAGMHASVEHLISKLAPDRFEPRDHDGKPRQSWYPNHMQGLAWRNYATFYRDVLSESDTAFRRLVAERFMQVYEEQCRRLADSRT